MVKSRSLAAKLVQAGRVRVNREKAEQASQLVKPGDVLTMRSTGSVLVYRIVAAGARRGPAEEARQLYEDLSASRPTRRRRPERYALRDGSGRPTKKERRSGRQAHDGD